MSNTIYEDYNIRATESNGRVHLNKVFDEDKELHLTKRQLKEIWRKEAVLNSDSDARYLWEFRYRIKGTKEEPNHEPPMCVFKAQDILSASAVFVDYVMKDNPGLDEADIEVIQLFVHNLDDYSPETWDKPRKIYEPIKWGKPGLVKMPNETEEVKQRRKRRSWE